MYVCTNFLMYVWMQTVWERSSGIFITLWYVRMRKMRHCPKPRTCQDYFINAILKNHVRHCHSSSVRMYIHMYAPTYLHHSLSSKLLIQLTTMNEHKYLISFLSRFAWLSTIIHLLSTINNKVVGNGWQIYRVLEWQKFYIGRYVNISMNGTVIPYCLQLNNCKFAYNYIR